MATLNAITILTHDARWARLRPVMREVVIHCLDSPLEGESKSVQRDSVGGNAAATPPHGFARANPAPPQGGSYQVTLVLTNDAEVKALNHQYRSKNKPTNVLSFPDGSEIEGVTQLGDVVLSYDTLIAEARAQKKSLKSHAMHLAIHGTLHLLGFDHETDAQAHAMETLEIKLLARMGIANPYENS
ncbi:MAG: rRNA maturation RNase YbeY [Rickettsiales bacterium]